MLQDGLLVDVDGDDLVASHVEVVAHDLGGLGLSGFEDPVLPRVSEVGDHQGDGFGAHPVDRVLQEEHLDEVVVGICVLYDDHIVVQLLAVDPCVALTVGEPCGSCLNVRASEDRGQFLGQIPG